MQSDPAHSASIASTLRALRQDRTWEERAVERPSDPGHGEGWETAPDRPPMTSPPPGAPPPPPPPPPAQWNVPPPSSPPPYGVPSSHASWQAPPPAPSTGWRWDAGSILVIVGSFGAFIGAFLPWATLGAFSKAGTEGDGVITLILAVLGGLLGFAGISRVRSGMLIGSLICAALITLVAIIDIADIASAGDSSFGLEPDVGGGLILTLIAGGCGVVGAVLALVTQRRPR